MIERHLKVFTLAFLGIMLTVLVILIAGQPTGCLMGVPVNLPYTANAAVLPDTNRILKVTIRPDRGVMVGNQLVPMRDLRSVLAEFADRPIRLSADRAVPFALVQDVLRIARDAGCTNVSLVTFEGTVIEAYALGATSL